MVVFTVINVVVKELPYMQFLFHLIGLQVGDSDSCRSPQSLRLNRVKRLARTLNNSANSAMKEATGQNHRSGKEGME